MTLVQLSRTRPVPTGASRVPLAPSQGPLELVDPQARRVKYLRLSLTDRCNYRCTYCMPEDGIDHRPRSELLTLEELGVLVRAFAAWGVERVRLTGGEPTVRQGLVELVTELSQISVGGDTDRKLQVVMTTNGHLLDELAAPLAAAGLTAVNVSLDTLDGDRFRALTGRGDLSRVLAGIAAARAAGLAVKTNAVALRGVNEDEVVALSEHAWAVGAVPRFIEHMPMSEGQLYETAAELPAAEIRGRLEARFDALVPASAGRDAGPARY